MKYFIDEQCIRNATYKHRTDEETTKKNRKTKSETSCTPIECTRARIPYDVNASSSAPRTQQNRLCGNASYARSVASGNRSKSKIGVMSLRVRARGTYLAMGSAFATTLHAILPISDARLPLETRANHDNTDCNTSRLVGCSNGSFGLFRVQRNSLNQSTDRRPAENDEIDLVRVRVCCLFWKSIKTHTHTHFTKRNSQEKISRFFHLFCSVKNWRRRRRATKNTEIYHSLKSKKWRDEIVASLLSATKKIHFFLFFDGCCSVLFIPDHHPHARLALPRKHT